MRWLGLAAALALAGAVVTQFGWKWVLAPLLGYAFVRWSIGSLRAMTADSRATAHLDAPQPVPVARAERVLYWCEDCGTELLLVVRGTGKAPRHCATAMHEREELLGGTTVGDPGVDPARADVDVPSRVDGGLPERTAAPESVDLE